MDSFVDEMANAMVALTTHIAAAAAQNPPNPTAVTQSSRSYCYNSKSFKEEEGKSYCVTQNPPKKPKGQ